MTTNIDRRIQILATSLNADYYGVADLAPARDFIHAQGGERVSRYPRGIVIGMRLQDSMVELLPDGDKAGAILYKHTSYDVVNSALDQIALRVANVLQHAGYGAFPIPASKRTDDEQICGIFSQKLAAHLAGLGWIGMRCVTVLTDAPLVATGSPIEPRCGKCTACVDICPAHAFTGRIFSMDEPREMRFDAAACERYLSGQEGKQGVGAARAKNRRTDPDFSGQKPFPARRGSPPGTGRRPLTQAGSS